MPGGRPSPGPSGRWLHDPRIPSRAGVEERGRARVGAPEPGILRSAGYDGPIGLEYYPTQESEASVALIRDVATSA